MRSGGALLGWAGSLSSWEGVCKGGTIKEMFVGLFVKDGSPNVVLGEMWWRWVDAI